MSNKVSLETSSVGDASYIKQQDFHPTTKPSGFRLNCVPLLSRASEDDEWADATFTDLPGSKAAATRSREIDGLLQEHAKRLENEQRLIVFSDERALKERIRMHIVMFYRDYVDTDQIKMRQLEVYKAPMNSARHLFYHLEDSDLQPELEENRDGFQYLKEYFKHWNSSQEPEHEAVEALGSLTFDPCFEQMLQLSCGRSDESARYLLRNAKRLSKKTYVPNLRDMLQAERFVRIESMIDYRIDAPDVSLRILDLSLSSCPLPKRTQWYENIKFLVYAVDMASCIDVSVHDNDDEADRRVPFEASLHYFQSLFGKVFIESCYILILTNVEEFWQKVQASPGFLEKYFPDYTSGNDKNSVIQYISDKYAQQNIDRRASFTFIIDSVTQESFDLAFKDVHKVMCEKIQRGCWLTERCL